MRFIPVHSPCTLTTLITPTTLTTLTTLSTLSTLTMPTCSKEKEATAAMSGSVARCVCILDSPLIGSEAEELVLATIFPPSGEQSARSVFVLQQDSTAAVCPKGKVLLHLCAEGSAGDSPRDILLPVLEYLLQQAKSRAVAAVPPPAPPAPTTPPSPPALPTPSAAAAAAAVFPALGSATHYNGSEVGQGSTVEMAAGGHAAEVGGEIGEEKATVEDGGSETALQSAQDAASSGDGGASAGDGGAGAGDGGAGAVAAELHQVADAAPAPPPPGPQACVADCRLLPTLVSRPVWAVREHVRMIAGGACAHGWEGEHS